MIIDKRSESWQRGTKTERTIMIMSESSDAGKGQQDD